MWLVRKAVSSRPVMLLLSSPSAPPWPASSRAAALLQELLDSCNPAVAEDGTDGSGASAAAEAGAGSPPPLPAAALPHLEKLIAILGAKSKGQMCLECTCGDKEGPQAKLEDRAHPSAGHAVHQPCWVVNN